MPTCLFYIENFDCETTDSDKCFGALTMRIRSSNTPDAERSLFDSCAEWIYKKDPYRGAEAQALLHQEKNVIDESNEITIFGRHLPSFNYNTWQAFIQKNEEYINTFRLCRFLKERWLRLEPNDKPENIPPVERIIDLLKETYPKKKKEIQRSLKNVISDIKSINLESRENDIKKEINAHLRAKRWQDLDNYLTRLSTAGFSYNLIQLVTRKQQQAKNGVSWLDKKQKLVEVVEKSAKQSLDPDAFYQELMEAKDELIDLVKDQEEFGDADSIKEIRQFPVQLYLNILTAVKQSNQSPDNKFRQLKSWEDTLHIFKCQPPPEWDEYRDELDYEMANVYSDEIIGILNNFKNISQIKQAVNKSVKEAIEFNLKERINDYIMRGKIIDIFEIQRHIEELAELDQSLETITDVVDPFKVKFTLNKHLQDLGNIPDSTQYRLIFREITKKYQDIEEIIMMTRTTTDRLEQLAADMQKEARNILFNNPRIKSEEYERQLESIAEKTNQDIEKYAAAYQFKFLESLQRIIEVTGKLLFPDKTPKKTPAPLSDKDKLLENDFIKSIMESISTGNTFYQKLKQLKSQIRNRSLQDPAAIQDEFFELLSLYRRKVFIFTSENAKEVCKSYEDLLAMIHAKIDKYLKPIKNQLDFPFPLIEPGTLEELKSKTAKLLKQMDKIELSYPGFEEFVETYRDELGEWNHVIEVQEGVRQKKFEAAAASIEKGIYDPDIKYPAQILVYYYRYLHMSKWDENEWLNFFSRFSLDSIKTNQTGYQVILKHYRKDVRKNFKDLSLSTLDMHLNVFKTLYANDELIPYLEYLCRQSSPKEFFKAVERRSVLAEVFKGLVILLEKNEDWTRYIALYNHSPQKYKRYFEKPEEKVIKKLEEYYAELVEKFVAVDIKIADIDAYTDKIPEGQKFLTYYGKSKRLKDLLNSYKEITTNFKNLENADIWAQDGFINRLYETLGRHTEYFTDEFLTISTNNNWGKRVASLKNIYDQGRKLMELLDKMSQMDLDYKSKHDETYSLELKKLIQELLTTWTKFNDEITQLTENAVYKDSFQRIYFEGFIEKWKKMSFYPLHVEADIEPPGDLDGYFKMWENLLENHEQFLTYYNSMKDKKKVLRTQDLDKIKILDEFIRLTIERWKQQKRL